MRGEAMLGSTNRLSLCSAAPPSCALPAAANRRPRRAGRARAKPLSPASHVRPRCPTRSLPGTKTHNSSAPPESQTLISALTSLGCQPMNSPCANHRAASSFREESTGHPRRVCSPEAASLLQTDHSWPGLPPTGRHGAERQRPVSSLQSTDGGILIACAGKHLWLLGELPALAQCSACSPPVEASGSLFSIRCELRRSGASSGEKALDPAALLRSM